MGWGVRPARPGHHRKDRRCRERTVLVLVRWNAEYWTGGAVDHMSNTSGDSYLAASPEGYSVVATWGSARYNTAAQLTALVYRKNSADDPGGSVEHGEQLAQWALSQMNYIMGDNPLNRSYIVGFVAQESDHWVQHPHHRPPRVLDEQHVGPRPNTDTCCGALSPEAGRRRPAHRRDDRLRLQRCRHRLQRRLRRRPGRAVAYFGQDQEVATWTPPLEPEETAYYSRIKLEQGNKARTQVTIEINNRVTSPAGPGRRPVRPVLLRYLGDDRQRTERRRHQGRGLLRRGQGGRRHGHQNSPHPSRPTATCTTSKPPGRASCSGAKREIQFRLIVVPGRQLERELGSQQRLQPGRHPHRRPGETPNGYRSTGPGRAWSTARNPEPTATPGTVGVGTPVRCPDPDRCRGSPPHRGRTRPAHRRRLRPSAQGSTR